MKIFQKMYASTVIITTLLGTGGTINSVHADSIEQQSKLGIEQETDKQIIVKFKADLIFHMKMVLKNKYNLKRMIK